MFNFHDYQTKTNNAALETICVTVLHNLIAVIDQTKINDSYPVIGSLAKQLGMWRTNATNFTTFFRSYQDPIDIAETAIGIYQFIETIMDHLVELDARDICDMGDNDTLQILFDDRFALPIIIYQYSKFYRAAIIAEWCKTCRSAGSEPTIEAKHCLNLALQIANRLCESVEEFNEAGFISSRYLTVELCEDRLKLGCEPYTIDPIKPPSERLVQYENLKYFLESTYHGQIEHNPEIAQATKDSVLAYLVAYRWLMADAKLALGLTSPDAA